MRKGNPECSRNFGNVQERPLRKGAEGWGNCIGQSWGKPFLVRPEQDRPGSHLKKPKEDQCGWSLGGAFAAWEFWFWHPRQESIPVLVQTFWSLELSTSEVTWSSWDFVDVPRNSGATCWLLSTAARKETTGAKFFILTWSNQPLSFAKSCSSSFGVYLCCNHWLKCLLPLS